MVFYDDRKCESEHEFMFTHCLCKVLDDDYVQIKQQYVIPKLRRRVDFVLFYYDRNHIQYEKFIETKEGDLILNKDNTKIFLNNLEAKIKRNNISPAQIIGFEVDGSQHDTKIDAIRDSDLIKSHLITSIIRIPAWGARYYPYQQIGVIYHLFPYLFERTIYPVQSICNQDNIEINPFLVQTLNEEPYKKLSFVYKEIHPSKEDTYWEEIENYYAEGGDVPRNEIEEIIFNKYSYSKNIFIKYIHRKLDGTQN